MADSKLRDLSTDFAVKVIKMCDGIKGHYSLVNQLERSSTSIGANIHEANYAHSKADFIFIQTNNIWDMMYGRQKTILVFHLFFWIER